MKYRLVLVNTDTKERKVQYQQFTSKKKAIDYADKWKKSFPNADCEVYEEDLKTKIY